MKSETENGKTEKIREISGVFLFLGALFLVIALATHSAGDWAQVSYPVNAEVQNKCGKIGAGVSYWMFKQFGLTAYVIASLMGLWGVMIFLRKAIKDFWLKMAGAVLLVASSATFFGLLTPKDYEKSWLYASLRNLGAGGDFGASFAKGLSANLGSAGSYIAVAFVLIGSLLLGTDWLFYHLVVGFMKLSGAVYGQLEKGMVGAIGLVKAWKKTDREVPRTEKSPKAVAGVDDENDEDDVEEIVVPRKTAKAAKAEIVDKAPELEPEPEPEPLSPPLPPVPVIVPAQPKQEEKKQVEATEPSPAPVKAAIEPKSKEPKEKPKQETGDRPPFVLPPMDIFENVKEQAMMDTDREVSERTVQIESTLKSFDIDARVKSCQPGPVLTTYEIELSPGVSVHRINAMGDDLAIALKVPTVSIVSPLQGGRSGVGIEVPNAYKGVVRMRSLVSDLKNTAAKMKLPLLIGRDAAGGPIACDLAEMPHMLVAGTTGSGKSVCLAAIILSLLHFKRPDEVKLLLIDPKMVELSVFKDVPHLFCPVVTEMKKAPMVLEWITRQMDERYQLLSRFGVKKIETYNELGEKRIREKLAEDGEDLVDTPVKLPYIVVVVDELADMMMVASKDVEHSITRIAQKSRAVGIHLVIATQRPSVDVITGLIKSNIPSRLSFKVAAKVDSRTILDKAGAERLLGKGDMLIQFPGAMELLRAQCVFITESEIHKTVEYLQTQGAPEFNDELTTISSEEDLPPLGEDELYEQAAQIVVESHRGSVSLLQRRLGVGYGRAARLIDMMARDGVVGPFEGSKARQVIVSLEEWEARKGVRPQPVESQE
jgi:S-DNA-T family DNA segregation ATPase FtsK/SpoIIIE